MFNQKAEEKDKINMNRKLFLCVYILCSFIMCLLINFFGTFFQALVLNAVSPSALDLKITLSASFPEDLELNRDFNGDDYEYEDEAKLVIFPDHFEIPLPNIEELPALVSESVCSCALYALHAKGLICRFSFSACLSNVTSLHFILSTDGLILYILTVHPSHCVQ